MVPEGQQPRPELCATGGVNTIAHFPKARYRELRPFAAAEQ